MSSDIMKCPHCECKVRISDVEKDDGMCPECGQLITIGRGGDLFDDYVDGINEDMDDMEEEYIGDDMDMEEDDFFDDDTEPDILDELNADFDDTEFAPKPSKRGRKRKSDND